MNLLDSETSLKERGRNMKRVVTLLIEFVTERVLPVCHQKI